MVFQMSALYVKRVRVRPLALRNALTWFAVFVRTYVYAPVHAQCRSIVNGWFEC